VATTILAIREVIEAVSHPRKLTFEEGPLADWLLRNLSGSVEEVVVCDPRKNALVAKDGDKDDPIDAGKLCDLFIGGYVRAVHHAATLGRQVIKQTVGLYHERVGHRVSEANKLIGRFKRWGVIISERHFARAEDREGLLERLGSQAEQEAVKEHMRLLWAGYDEAVRAQGQLHREMVRLARGEEQVVRWEALPGIGWIRGLTIFAYVDTPWRFRSKQALWKYMGLGLVRERSGEGSTFVHVERGANRMLKSVIMGAAESAIMQGGNAFAEQFSKWTEAGLTRRNARRNVARSMSGVMWGMWKNGGRYDPEQVGRASAGAG
jgi:transposase